MMDFLPTPHHKHITVRRVLYFHDGYIRASYMMMVTNSSNVFCAVDPMSPWFAKECLDVLIYPITKMINTPSSLDVHNS